jgi:LmbE family N-acetylglucosaminyl deacetylase
MRFSDPMADIHVPAGALAPAEALRQVTHLCVAAHQDDIEIMAHAGICDCLEAPERRAFGGVVVTDGAGSPRTGPYAHLTDAQMKDVRRQEQRRAAELGRYRIQIQLAHPSARVKQSRQPEVVADLTAIFAGCSPEVVYLHNPADKHDTHIAVLQRCVEALRSLPAGHRPRRVLGVEVWRDLDWLDAGRRPELALELVRAFDSQVTGGKRYDLASQGRRTANATYSTPRATDQLAGITWAWDLTPVLDENGPSLEAFTLAQVDQFRRDVQERLRRFA